LPLATVFGIVARFSQFDGTSAYSLDLPHRSDNLRETEQRAVPALPRAHAQGAALGERV